MQDDNYKSEALEDKIYAAYYKMYPKGDARFALWPEVIKAKKQPNSEEELLKILKRYENEVKKYHGAF